MKTLTELILKYETSGPRYTSYPTAPHFFPECNKDELAQAAIAIDAHRSLYIHIPFCRTQCLFCGCSSSVCTDPKKADAYLDLLEKELALWQNLGLKKCELEQIHFGGGTPNFLLPEQISRLRDIIKSGFEISKTCEYSVELDPRTLTKDKVEAFAKIGINRASIGVQDTNENVQRAIARIQPMSMNLQSFEWLREFGIKKINIDLMYGLPLQDKDNFKNTINDAISLNPDRIALFNYAHVPWLKSTQKPLEKYQIPTGVKKVELFEMAMIALKNAGFEYIGLDHFALPQDELISARKSNTLQRNFQGYSTRAGLESFSLGLTSISQTKNTYRQNFKIYQEYERAINNSTLPIERGIILTAEDELRRKIIMDIMCLLRLDFKKFEAKYNFDFKTKFNDAFPILKEMQADGILELNEDAIILSEVGRLFVRNVAMLFDGRLSDKFKYSKTL